MKRSSLDKVRESLRLQQVYNVLARYGWDMALSRWPAVNDLRLVMQQWIWDLPDDLADVSTPVKVRLMIEELGPTYVKMGQIVSSQSAAVPLEWADELAKLQSSVPPFPSDEVREVIQDELGAPPRRSTPSSSRSRSPPPRRRRCTAPCCATARKWWSRCSGRESATR